METLQDFKDAKYIMTTLILTVGRRTELLCGEQPVSGRKVGIKVNGTLLDGVTTASDGSYTATLCLPAVDDKPTNYQVEAVFYGDSGFNLTGYAYAPDNTRYAVCSTVQYFPYKPACNSTFVTVDPQALHVIMSKKTPEQLQAEAEQSGCFRIEHRFSWWYPWWRMHLILEADLPQGHLWMDYGWTFLPFGQSFDANQVIAYIFNDMTTNIAIQLIKSFAITWFVQNTVALLAGKTLVGIVAAIVIYTTVSLLETYFLYETSGKNPEVWLAAFIVSAISGTFGLFKAKLEGLTHFLTAVSRRVLGEISHVMNSFWARGLNFFDITGIAFSLIDFAFLVLYLTQFLSLIA